jgi:hypothetical protein
MSSSPTNPNNPFVRNEQFFANKTGAYVYKETQLYYIRIVHHIVAGVFGLFLAFFVFFLILKRSTRRLQPYRKMFLISATVDLALLVEFLMVQSVGFGFVKSSL